MFTESFQQVYQIVILLFSAIIHEYMHGWTADRLGDPTAKSAGRLTLNPLVHIDIFGSILLPFLLIISKAGFVFGWAKPVPFNPYNLRNMKYGPALVAAAGPLTNMFLAVVFGLSLRFFGTQLYFYNDMLPSLVAIIVLINLLLMIFNLIPIPPLDGSKILLAFLPVNWQLKFLQIERMGMFLVLAFIVLGYSQFIFPTMIFLFELITGTGL